MADPGSGTEKLRLSGANPWRRHASNVLYDNGRLQLREDEVTGPDGLRGTYTYVQLQAPVVVMVPVDAAGYVHLVRQWRYPWGRNSWEVPAGHCEPGEAPFAGAQRELAEEVGLRADAWHDLGAVYSSATIQGDFHLYLARELTPVPAIQRDGSEEDLIATRVPLARARQAALDGTIVHAVTIVALLRAVAFLAEEAEAGAR